MRSSMLAMIGCLGMMFVVAAVGQEAASSPAGDQQPVADMCRDTVCQYNVRVQLKRKDGAVFDRTFEVMPGVVQPSYLAILAGQSLHIEADRVGDRLTNFRVVESVVHPEKTLAVTFQQSDDGGMLLKLSNPFDQALKFNMGMMSLDSDRLVKTSSCPVIAGGSSFESWPQPLFQVVLANAHFVDLSKGNVACN